MNEPTKMNARRPQTLIGAASLAVGPLIMASGNLMHPAESSDISAQAAIIVDHATRWYLAHLVLLVGMVLFIPGLLSLADLASARKPRIGYAARVLLMIGVAGSCAIFLAEVLAGRFGAAGLAQTESFLDTMFSAPIAGLMIPIALAFFVGAGVFAVPLIAGSGPLRWPAVVFLGGTLLVLGEIITSQVLLSQIGGVLVWGGSVAFARLLVRGDVSESAAASTGIPLPAG
jgi:hypothetical protein